MSAAPPAARAVSEQPDGGSSVPVGLWRRIDKGDLCRTMWVALCAAGTGVAGLLDAPWPVLAGVAVLGLGVGCWPILVEAWEDVRRRRMGMELSMLIAIVAAAAIGAWVTSLVITAFVLAAEILEDLSLDRGRDTLTDLMSFLPATVRIRDGDELHAAPLESVTAGQIVVISPGSGIPVDGTVITGRSSVDQSRITGESLPVDVEPGATVYAGSINQTGAVEVRAGRVGAQSSYGQIIEAVREAQSSRAPAQRLADRLAAWLVYLAMAGAVATFVATWDLRVAISVVVVAGACGIAAGTPLAVLAALARTARAGAFVKGGTHLEQLSTVDTVIVDKTGTLTHGIPEVVDILPADGFGAEELLGYAAAAEWYSEHPLGQAIVAHARRREVAVHEPEPDSFDYQPGCGVTARVDGLQVRIGNVRLVPEATGCAPEPARATAVRLAIGTTYAGTVRFADTPRASAAQCVSGLRRLGLRVVMLTGDSPSTARAVGDELHIDDVRAGLLPTEKLDAIDAERAAGHRTAMIGDGVNDAPALTRSDVGIAMGTGTDIARDTADVILVNGDLTDIPRAVRIARRARRVVLANFAGTVAVDLAGMTLAGFGLIGPVLAAVVHVGSESAFILNSARLIPTRSTR